MVCANLFFGWDNGLGLEVDTWFVEQRGDLPNSLDLVWAGYCGYAGSLDDKEVICSLAGDVCLARSLASVGQSSQGIGRLFSRNRNLFFGINLFEFLFSTLLLLNIIPLNIF